MSPADAGVHHRMCLGATSGIGGKGEDQNIGSTLWLYVIEWSCWPLSDVGRVELDSIFKLISDRMRSFMAE